ncbi:MAG: hypothetical protein H6Q40_548, partial [Deltaproteobacteria bacterium]|nr:hypothetical protein [Deltaproteobacteria bacterium]
HNPTSVEQGLFVPELKVYPILAKMVKK